MQRIFTIWKEGLRLELHIGERVEVRPLPSKGYTEESMSLRAYMHQVILASQALRYRTENLVQLAVKYFKNKGFNVEENK